MNIPFNGGFFTNNLPVGESFIIDLPEPLPGNASILIHLSDPNWEVAEQWIGDSQAIEKVFDSGVVVPPGGETQESWKMLVHNKLNMPMRVWFKATRTR